jgi:hypothetical protein
MANHPRHPVSRAVSALLRTLDLHVINLSPTEINVDQQRPSTCRRSIWNFFVGTSSGMER